MVVEKNVTYSTLWSPWSTVQGLLVELLHIVELHYPVEVLAPPSLSLWLVEHLPAASCRVLVT